MQNLPRVLPFSPTCDNAMKGSRLIAGDSHEGLVMRYGVDSFSPSSWEPQEEGMINIAARFSLSKKPRYVGQERKEPIRLKVMPASCVML
jgi:hypothetical protein